MSRGLVLAVNAASSALAVETEEGACAVFLQRSGPMVLAGDVLEGALLAQDVQLLRHADGDCAVVFEGGPLSRADALAWVHGADAASTPAATPDA